jgi:hypothetical protein
MTLAGDEWSASLPCYFSPVEIASGTHEPQSRPGPYGGEKNLFLLQGIETQFLSIAADRLIALLTELSTVLIFFAPEMLGKQRRHSISVPEHLDSRC